MRLAQGFNMCSALTKHSNEGLMRLELKAINGKFRTHYLKIVKSRTGGDCFANVTAICRENRCWEERVGSKKKIPSK